MADKIVTACDFTEIFAYATSAASTFLSRLEPGFVGQGAFDNRAVLSQLHDQIMEFFLFDSSQKLWLLDPYLLELQWFRSEIRTRRFEGVMENSGQALREVAAASSDPEFQRIAAFAKAFVTDGVPIDDAQAERVWGFLQKIAPALVELTKDETSVPKDRLDRLLATGTLVIPNDLADEIRDGDPVTFDRWYKVLSNERPERDRSNAADAKAIAVIFSINDWLRQTTRPQRLTLLTRSEAMHRLMRSRSELQYWEDVGGNPLRHPRGVLALLDRRGEIVPSRDIKGMRETLDRWSGLFSMIVDRRVNVANNLTEREIFNRHVAVIADVWQKYCRVRASKIAIEANYLSNYASLKAIAAIVDQNAMKRTILAQMKTLDGELSGSQFMVGALLAPDMDGARQYLEHAPEPVQAKPQTGTAKRSKLMRLNGLNGDPLPYRVGFQATRFINVLSQEGHDPWLAFSSVTQPNMMAFEGRARRNGLDPEWSLAVAFVCSAFGAWETTMRACDQARDNRHAPDLNVELLSARAARQVPQGKADLAKALDRVRAVKAKAEGLLDRARVASEILKLRFLLALRAHETPGGDFEGLKVHLLPALMDGVAVFRDTTKPSIECAELLNNMVYHASQMADVGRHVWDWSEISPWFIEMERNFNEVYGADIEAWPPNLVDTYCWVRLKLLKKGLIGRRDGVDLVDEQRRIFEPLARIREFEHLSQGDEQDYRLHAVEAARFFGISN